MGGVAVPADAYWGAQSQRAIDNFGTGRMTLPEAFIRSVAIIKYAAAAANTELELLKPEISGAIAASCREIMEGKLGGQFLLGVFQTGSGTSTNMNVNEVVATRANELLTGHKHTGRPVHPNDHVNMGQSSNDVIPSAIRLASYLEVSNNLLPALKHLLDAVSRKQQEYKDVIKTGRTHLMDAVPITFGQEFSGWAAQVGLGIARIESVLPRLAQLPLGGTAIGTGLNAHPEFSRAVLRVIREITGLPFAKADNNFEAQASMDIAAELSGQLKTIAVGLMKIITDIRLMNSGPHSGLAEIQLPPLQPGSSIMPGKINPVIAEAGRMACAKVLGNDAAIAVSCALGEFELNTMLPVIGYSLLESIDILSHAMRLLADKSISGMTVNSDRVLALLEKNPIIATTLAPVIGYENTAMIIKKALDENRKIREVVLEAGLLSEKEVDFYLDIKRMVQLGKT